MYIKQYSHPMPHEVKVRLDCTLQIEEKNLVHRIIWQGRFRQATNIITIEGYGNQSKNTHSEGSSSLLKKHKQKKTNDLWFNNYLAQS